MRQVHFTCIFNIYIDMCMYISTCVAGGVYPYSLLSLSLSLCFLPTMIIIRFSLSIGLRMVRESQVVEETES